MYINSKLQIHTYSYRDHKLESNYGIDEFQYLNTIQQSLILQESCYLAIGDRHSNKNRENCY
jgi:hypothetical protein